MTTRRDRSSGCDDGTSYRVPAEWESRDGTLLAWPPEHPWLGASREVIACFSGVVELLRAHEPVFMLVPPDDRDRIARELGGEDESLRLEPYPVNDIWMRDAGPICASCRSGNGVRPIFLDGGFNGWGRKHPHELDRLIPTVLGRRWGVERVRTPIIIEGGAVETNGAGDLLTTSAVLLDPERDSPGREQVEPALRRYLGAERIHWLDRGLEGDDTGGHIDNLARFAGPSSIVCCGTGLPEGHPNARLLKENRRRLDEVRTADGRAEIVELPVPDVTAPRGRRLPASYTNFYLASGLVLVPVFGQTTDDEALGVLRDVYPDRRVEGMDALPILAQGGAFHCITQPLHLKSRAP